MKLRLAKLKQAVEIQFKSQIALHCLEEVNALKCLTVRFNSCLDILPHSDAISFKMIEVLHMMALE